MMTENSKRGKFERLKAMGDLASTCKCPICKDVYNSLTLASSSVCPHLGHDIIAYYESMESDVMELRETIERQRISIQIDIKMIAKLTEEIRSLQTSLRNSLMRK